MINKRCGSRDGNPHPLYRLKGATAMSIITPEACSVITYYLYIKTHNQTGIKYLGQTTRHDPFTYPGSGSDWLEHLGIYGFDYTTEILLASTDPDEIAKLGEYYSEKFRIVESKEWANKVPETGPVQKSKRYTDNHKKHLEFCKELANKRQELLKKYENNMQSKGYQREIAEYRKGLGLHTGSAKLYMKVGDYLNKHSDRDFSGWSLWQIRMAAQGSKPTKQRFSKGNANNEYRDLQKRIQLLEEENYQLKAQAKDDMKMLVLLADAYDSVTKILATQGVQQ